MYVDDCFHFWLEMKNHVVQIGRILMRKQLFTYIFDCNNNHDVCAHIDLDGIKMKRKILLIFDCPHSV